MQIHNLCSAPGRARKEQVLAAGESNGIWTQPVRIRRLRRLSSTGAGRSTLAQPANSLSVVVGQKKWTL